MSRLFGDDDDDGHDQPVVLTPSAPALCAQCGGAGDLVEFHGRVGDRIQFHRECYEAWFQDRKNEFAKSFFCKSDGVTAPPKKQP
jgi:hypothetical protein